MERLNRKSEIKMFETVQDVLKEDGSLDHQDFTYTVEVDGNVIAEEITLKNLFKRIIEGWC